MKLLIATPLYPPEIGGPATYAATLEVELPRRRVDVRLVKFSSVKHLPKVIRHIAYFFKIYSALRGVDVVLALDAVSVGFPTALAAKIRGTKLLVKIVGDYAWEQGQQRYGVTVNLDEFVKIPTDDTPALVGFLRGIQSFVARHAAHIIVPSNYLKGVVATWGISEENITVIYNAFSGTGELPTKDEAREQLQLSGRVIVSAGRLVPWKGFQLLMEIVGKLRATYPDLRLYIAGSGPDNADLNYYIAKNKLHEVVVMLGSIEHGKLMKYIRAADCFVLNTGYEGLSHQLLEVLAVGTPIVTTNVGGNVELIVSERNGLLVPFNDEPALTMAVTRVLNDESGGIEMTEQGKTFVAQFTTYRMMEETIRALDK